MSLDCTRFAFLNPLLLMHWLGAGSVAVVWVLGLIDIKSAQANLAEQPTTRLEPSRIARITDVGKSHTQENEVPAQQSDAVLSPELPIPQPISVLPNSTPVAKEHSVTPTSPLSLVKLSATGGANSTVKALTDPLILAASKSTSIVDSERLTSASQRGCITGKICSNPIPSGKLIVPSESSKKTLAQLPYLPQPLPVPASPIPVGSDSSNTKLESRPYLPQPLSPVPMNGTGLVVYPNSFNTTLGQVPYLPQPSSPVPMTTTGLPVSPNSYNPAVGQSPYYPQTVLLVPMMASPSQGGMNGYNPAMGQSPYYPQPVLLVPMMASPSQGGVNGYNPMVGQSPYSTQMVPAIAPSIPGGVNGYNPMAGQYPSYPQSVPSLPPPLTPSPVGSNNSYNPMAGQSAYYPQSLPINPSPSAGGFNGYNPMVGQSPYYQQPVQALPAPQTQSPIGSGSYNPMVGQSPYCPQSSPVLPYAPNPNLTSPVPSPTTLPAPNQQPASLRSTALTDPYLRFQGAYVNQGDASAARARLTGLYPLNPRVQFGGTLDLISGKNIFSDSRGEGLNINELYIATAPFADLPNLRLVAGQLDLTSYFDRNSFAKDAVTHFFNPVFQTNPALSATGISPRPAVLVNWSVTDHIEAKAAVFSSARSIGDFSADGFAGEIGFRHGNAVIRGTYATDRDAGNRDGFQEIFQVNRGGGRTGLLRTDREEAYGVNGEYFFPQLHMGVFARYGRYENQALSLGGNTYSLGINFLDLIAKDDRLGLAYGRGLSNEQLRREFKDNVPDVLELFYDFKFLPNIRLGVTLQERNNFSETYGGFRVKTEFDITPRGRLAP